jgi:glycosyltransferase involved in cell wall biosynthesis
MLIDVAIILPCYNEAATLRKTVLAVRNLMDKTVYKYEIIVAEDASQDGTAKIAKELSQEFGNVIWLHRESRAGRGSAVSNAIRNSRARIAGFIDVDLETPVHYIFPLILEIDKGADIATCIRLFKLNKYQLVLRLPKVLSHYCYLWLVRWLLGTKLQDTEAGLKFFNRLRILEVLDEVKNQHWFWDTEIMVRAYYKGYRIKEIATLFLPDYKRVSKVNLWRDSLDYLANLLRFRKELRDRKNAEAKTKL